MDVQSLRELVAYEPRIASFFENLRFILRQSESFDALIEDLKAKLEDLKLEVDKSEKKLENYNRLVEQAASDSKLKVEVYEDQAAKTLAKLGEAKADLEAFKQSAQIEHAKIADSLVQRRRELSELEVRVGEAKATLAKLKGI